MTVEQMIRAKIELAEVEALWGGGFCLALFILGTWLCYSGWFKSHWDDDVREMAVVFGASIAFIAGCLLVLNVYSYTTAEAQAKADLANFNLQQINLRLYNDAN